MENVYDRVLEEQGLNYEDLNPEEKSTYTKANFATQSLTIGDVIKYISRMKSSVGLQLAGTPISEELKIVHLQSRLMNYILMEMFLQSPERAEEALKKQIELSSKGKK